MRTHRDISSPSGNDSNHVEIRDLAAVVLPYGCRDGILGMLTAYFDDSGTHSGSEITLLAGLFGHKNQWDHFNKLWRKRLDESVPGKPPVTRFHMVDCFGSFNEFAGWNRTETTFFAKELSDIIFRCGLWGCSSAIAPKPWDRYITGDLRRASGDAEGGCVRVCFNTTLQWAAEFSGASHIAFVFDDRPRRKKEYEAVYQVYSDYRHAMKLKPELVSLTFANARNVLPLQAADLVAWEVYHDELHFLKNGAAREGQFHRELLMRLAKSGRFRIQIGDEAAIIKSLPLAEKNLRAAGTMDQLDKYFGKT